MTSGLPIEIQWLPHSCDSRDSRRKMRPRSPVDRSCSCDSRSVCCALQALPTAWAHLATHQRWCSPRAASTTRLSASHRSSEDSPAPTDGARRCRPRAFSSRRARTDSFRSCSLPGARRVAPPSDCHFNQRNTAGSSRALRDRLIWRTFSDVDGMLLIYKLWRSVRCQEAFRRGHCE